MKARSLVLSGLLILGMFGSLQLPKAHASTGTVSWSNDYTNGGLFSWWSPGNNNLVEGSTCGSCDGTGISMYVQHQASNGGGATGGVMTAFEDRFPAGAAQYYYCSSTGRCGFYVPNYGESSVSIDISGVYHVLGYIGALGDKNCLFCSGSLSATARFEVDLWIWQDQATSLDATYYSKALLSDAVSCTSIGCNFANSYNQDYTFSITGITLNSGHFYHVGLRFYSTVATSTVGGNTNGQNTKAEAYGCFQWVSGNGWTCQQGFSGTPAGAGSCPSQIQSPCYYLQWKSATYTLYEPDFSMSAPTPLSFNPATGTTATVTASSVNSLNGALTLSAIAPDDSSLRFLFNPSSVTPPSNGNAYSSMTITDTNGCDTGTHLVNVSGTVSDGTLSITHTVSIYVTLNYSCPDFTISANPSSITMLGGGAWGSAGCPTPQVVLQSTGYSGTVSVSVSPNSNSGGPVWAEINSANAVSVTLSSGGTGTPTITAQIWASYFTTGTYTVTFTATTGTGLNHSASVTVTFGPNYNNNCGQSGGGGGGPKHT